MLLSWERLKPRSSRLKPLPQKCKCSSYFIFIPKFGLCLLHCPAYTKTQNENELPSGRIALIQSWAGHHLGTPEKLIEHIDNCLLCRSCEIVCPADRLVGHIKRQSNHSNPHSTSPVLTRLGISRGFLPRGLFRLCPPSSAASWQPCAWGQTSDNP